mmetsp:Transcript_63862/g.140642  ORF Transcript_63862/g.140642 Transcript_63862/m.140642 type:complete len:363 (+) Transcript_63862:66-1154(+)
MEARDREDHEDGPEPESKRDPAKKAVAGDQKQGNGAKKAGKAERAKAAPKPKADGDNSEDDREDREKGGEKKGRSEKAKEKKDNWKDRGDKKDAWKERRRKQDKADDGGSGGKKEGGDTPSASQPLNGGVLLSMLKANPPSIVRYTREELLSIGQLPASKVKPSSLNVIIDKENAASPLLVKVKAEKAGRRRGEGEEEDFEEEGGRELRPSRAPRAERGARRGDSDQEEEDGDKRRGRQQKQWGEEQSWKEEPQRHQQQHQQQQASGQPCRATLPMPPSGLGEASPPPPVTTPMQCGRQGETDIALSNLSPEAKNGPVRLPGMLREISPGNVVGFTAEVRQSVVATAATTNENGCRAVPELR